MAFESPFGPAELPPEDQELSGEERELLRKVAQKVIDWHMTVPAILFLESTKPLSYIGSQVMVFFEPFVQALFDVRNYNIFRRMMEKRDNVERLLQKIEELDAVQLEQERRERKKRRAIRKARRKRFFRKLLGRELPEDTSPPK